VVALITRCEARGFVQRRPSERDGREVEVHLAPRGERLLIRLASLHRAELKATRDVFPVPVIEG
jgi:DNA-binding MarR family transcriptional regulator